MQRYVPPDLEAADAAYAAALAALDEVRPPTPTVDWERVRSKHAAAAAGVRAARVARGPPPPPLDERRRSPLTIKYDAAHFDLAAAVRRVLEVDADFPLDRAHELWMTLDPADPPPTCPALLCALARTRKLPRSWRALAARRKEHIKAFRATAAYGAFVAAFRRFVADVVAPVVGKRVAFQCPADPAPPFSRPAGSRQTAPRPRLRGPHGRRDQLLGAAHASLRHERALRRECARCWRCGTTRSRVRRLLPLRRRELPPPHGRQYYGHNARFSRL